MDVDVKALAITLCYGCSGNHSSLQSDVYQLDGTQVAQRNTAPRSVTREVAGSSPVVPASSFNGFDRAFPPISFGARSVSQQYQK
jgi:hypothetical protein